MPAALPKLRRVIIYVRTLFLSSFPGRDQLKPLSPGKPLSPAYRLAHRRLGEAEQACYRYCSHAQLPHCPVADQISNLNPLRLLAGEQNEIFIYTQPLTHSSNNGLKMVSSCMDSDEYSGSVQESMDLPGIGSTCIGYKTIARSGDACG